jgi:hypothetical protein
MNKPETGTRSALGFRMSADVRGRVMTYASDRL